MFRKNLLNFIRPSEKSIYNICEEQGSKILTRLWLGFSHLREHNFSHNLQELWIRYAHVLLRLRAQIIFFNPAKIMYHFAQPLWIN